MEYLKPKFRSIAQSGLNVHHLLSRNKGSVLQFLCSPVGPNRDTPKGKDFCLVKSLIRIHSGFLIKLFICLGWIFIHPDIVKLLKSLMNGVES